MAIEVRIPTILRTYTDGAKQVEGTGATLDELITNLDKRHGGLRERLGAGDEEIDVILLDQATRIGRMCQALLQDPEIESAWLSWFDVMVAGAEDYHEMIAVLDAEQGKPVGWLSHQSALRAVHATA